MQRAARFSAMFIVNRLKEAVCHKTMRDGVESMRRGEVLTVQLPPPPPLEVELPPPPPLAAAEVPPPPPLAAAEVADQKVLEALLYDDIDGFGPEVYDA